MSFRTLIFASTLFLLPLCQSIAASIEQIPLEWGNRHVTFRFDRSRGYDLIGVKDLHTGRELLDKKLQNPNLDNLWDIALKDADNHQVNLGNHSKATIKHETSESGGQKKLTITWKGICDKAGKEQATVVVTGVLPKGASIAEWRISVTAQPPFKVWTTRFPSVSGIRDLGDDYAIIPKAMGRIVWDPTKRISTRILPYPGYCAVPFVAAWGSEQLKLTPPSSKKFGAKGWVRGAAPDEAGIYMAIHDPNSNYKLLETKGYSKRKTYGWAVVNFPAYKEWPLKNATSPYHYEVPYSFALGVFNGTAEDAAEIYRSWGLKQSWAQRGPLSKPNKNIRFPQSKAIKDTVFWGKFYHEPGKVVPELADFSNYLQVPVSTHYYRYYIAPFDNNNPEFLPVDPYFRRGIADLNAMNVAVMPYINMFLWDMDTESWYKENATANALQEAGGTPGRAIFQKGNPLGVMNPGAPGWQKKLESIAEKLVVEYGVNGLYLDQLATETRQTYSPDLNMVHGGNYWAKGVQKISEVLYKKMRSSQPDAFITGESFCDAFMDSADGFLMLDVLRMGWAYKSRRDIYPLSQMTYHDYAVFFGGDMDPRQEPDFFAWQLGLALTWGTQLMYSTSNPPPTSMNPKNNEFLREAAHATQQVAKKFLTGGRWVKCALVPDKKLIGNAPVSVVSPEHQVTYSYKRNHFPWDGPSVLASAWEAYDKTLGIVLTNITQKPVKATLRVDGKALKLAGKKLWNLWPLPVASSEKLNATMKTIVLTLPPRSVKIFQIGGDSKPEVAALKKIDWHLTTSDSNGKFAPQKVEGRNLWGCVDSIVANDISSTNTLTFLNANGNAVRQVKNVVKWDGKREGHGLPRAPEDKSFFLLQSTPYSLSVNATAKVQAVKGLLYAELSLKSNGVLSGPSDAILFTRDKNGKLIRSQGKLELSAGKHTVAAIRIQDITSSKVPGTAEITQMAKELASSSNTSNAISKFSMSVLKFVQNSESHAQTTHRLHLEKQLTAAADYLTRLITGIRGQLIMSQDWLAPAMPLKFTTQFTNETGKTIQLVKLDFVSRNKKLTNVVEVKSPVINGSQTLSKTKANNYEFTLTAPDDSHVEQLFPFQIQAIVESNGKQYGIPLLGWVNIDRPLTFKCHTALAEVPTGVECRAKFEVINISPYDITSEILLELPKGWTAGEGNPQHITVPANGSKEFELTLASPKDESVLKHTINCYIRYNNQDATRVLEQFKVNLLSNFEPILKASRPSPRSWQKCRFRHNQKFMLYAKAGDTINATVRADRVGRNKTVLYTLLGPDLKILAKGKIGAQETGKINVKAEKTGNHYLETKSGAVRGGNTWRVRVNSPAHGGLLLPLNLFASVSPLYAFVPKGTKEFRIALNTRPTSPALLEIIRPDGSIVIKEEGSWNNNWLTVKVPHDMDGRVWTIKLDPAADLQVRFSDDIAPCLSPSPNGVVKIIGQDSSKLSYDSLVPVKPHSSALFKTWKGFRFRRKQTVLLYAKAGETIRTGILAERLGKGEKSTVHIKLFDPDFKILAQEDIAPGKLKKAYVKATQTGIYTLKISSPVNSWRTSIIGSSHGGYLATAKSPLAFFVKASPLYAYVPKGAKQFRIALQDGGKNEPAALEIIAPNKSVAFKKNGNWSNKWVTIKVPSGMDGKAWIIKINPKQDLSFKLDGDIVPCLSPSPGGILK